MPKIDHTQTLIRILGLLGSFIGLVILLFGNVKTVENFRFLNDIIQASLVLVFMYFFLLPPKIYCKAALYLGIFVMIYDLILETIAVKLDWWYPLGGWQFPPVIIVPLQMVLGFLFIGASIGILFSAPELIRESESIPHRWLHRIANVNHIDYMWWGVLILGTAWIGMNGDYGAGEEIWQPGQNWDNIYTFYIWFFGSIISLGFYLHVLQKIKRKSI